MTGYAFHPGAASDLEEIWDFLAEASVDYADRVVEEVHNELPSLVRFPHQGHWRRDLTGRPLCFKRVRDYLIAYAPQKRPLWVIAVLHGARDPRVLAAILQGREE
jgi:plasmid stabilization system protein ParE